ncbi:MAG TPA: hypothetical protein VKR32_12090, partial [Puia sp.]|nr:hypothetical protein [Puia sp.]
MVNSSIFRQFGFSLNTLLPIVKLDDRYKFDFGGWQLWYFYFQEMMGFILSSFVVAGLAGITKK